MPDERVIDEFQQHLEANIVAWLDEVRRHVQNLGETELTKAATGVYFAKHDTPRSPHSEHDPRTKAYHATTPDRAESIQSQGLLTDVFQPNFDGISKQGRIYLTTEEDEAKYYGDMIAGLRGEEEYTVLEFELPPDNVEQLMTDPNATQQSITFFYEGDLPPEWIVSSTTHKASFTPRKLRPDSTTGPELDGEPEEQGSVAIQEERLRGKFRILAADTEHYFAPVSVEVAESLRGSSVEKHLPGQHEQKKHGRLGIELRETDDADELFLNADSRWFLASPDIDPGRLKQTVMEKMATSFFEADISEEDAAACYDELSQFVELGFEEKGDGPREDLASLLVKSWSISSSGMHPVSLAIQMAAAKKFGLDEDVPWASVEGVNTDALGTAKRWLDEDRYGSIFDAYVETVYDDTQEFLKKKFPHLDSFLVSRGMAWHRGGHTPPFEQYASERHLSEGGSKVLGPIKVESNPLTSFSFDLEAAEEFAGYGTAWEGTALLSGWVPRERIFSIPQTGPGCFQEAEAVLVGGEDVWNVAYVSRGNVKREDLFSAMEDPQEALVKRLDEKPRKIAAASDVPGIDEGENADWIKELTDDTKTMLTKHLPGEHDQLDHGPGGDESPDERKGPTAGHTKISDAPPGNYRVWRTGPITDTHGRGIFFAFGKNQVAMYRGLHDDAPIKEYKVELKKPLMAPNQHALLREWFDINGMGSAQAKWPKLDGPELIRKVDKMINARARAKGYDALVYYDSIPPAKQELVILKNQEVTEITPEGPKPADSSALWRRQGKALNEALRGGELSEEQEELAKDLDDAIDGSSAANGGTRFRGLRDGKFLLDLGIGGTYVDPGFVSVSDDDNVAYNFAERGRNPTLVMISVKKGSPALRVLKPGKSSIAQEHELLLGRGQTYRVKNIWPEREGDQVRTVVVEVASDVTKHLPGEHDQKKHGRHGRSDWSGEFTFRGKSMTKKTKERKRAKLLEKYGDDDEFKMFGAAVSLYTQGFFADIRRVGAAMATDTMEDLEANAVGFFGKGFETEGPELKPYEVGYGDKKDPIMSMVGGLYEVLAVNGEQMHGNITYTYAQQLAHSLANAIEHAEPTDDPLYRGVSLSDNLDLEVGDTFDIPGSASFTRSEEMGDKFATGKIKGMHESDGYRYLIRVEGTNRAVDVDVLSPWNQQEAITNGQFEVLEFTPASRHSGKRRPGAIGEIVLKQTAVVDADYTGTISYKLPKDVGKVLTPNEREWCSSVMWQLSHHIGKAQANNFFDLTDKMIGWSIEAEATGDDGSSAKEEFKRRTEALKKVSTAMSQMGYWVGENSDYAPGHVLVRSEEFVKPKPVPGEEWNPDAEEWSAWREREQNFDA